MDTLCVDQEPRLDLPGALAMVTSRVGACLDLKLWMSVGIHDIFSYKVILYYIFFYSVLTPNTTVRLIRNKHSIHNRYSDDVFITLVIYKWPGPGPLPANLDETSLTHS